MLELDVCRHCRALGCQVLKSANDGRLIICNGKHVVAALQAVQSTLKPNTNPGAAEEQPEWLSEELKVIFADGLRMDVVEFPDSDRIHHLAWCCISHEASGARVVSCSSRFSLAHFVASAHSFPPTYPPAPVPPLPPRPNPHPTPPPPPLPSQYVRSLRGKLVICVCSRARVCFAPTRFYIKLSVWRFGSPLRC